MFVRLAGTDYFLWTFKPQLGLSYDGRPGIQPAWISWKAVVFAGRSKITVNLVLRLLLHRHWCGDPEAYDLLIGRSLMLHELPAPATNARCQSEVQANGQFRFTALPIGDYSLHIESPSFANLIENVIHLSVGDTVRITATLSPATVQETVVVGAGADAIDLATNALGKTVTEREIVNLPLNGRNFAQLGLLQTGVWRSLRACR